MKWIVLVVALAACALSGFLGLTAGINLNPQTTVRFVPNWGSLGDWVSGIGAFSAVAVTLWLADKQRREDVENIRVSVRSAITDTGYGGWFIALVLTSDGKRTAKVTGLSIQSPHAKSYLQITQFWMGSDSLPASLSYGDSISLHLEPGFDRQISNFVTKHCNGNAKGLKIVARTTLHEFSGSIHKSLLTLSD
jgi:hypothetical protein